MTNQSLALAIIDLGRVASSGSIGREKSIVTTASPANQSNFLTIPSISKNTVTLTNPDKIGVGNLASDLLAAPALSSQHQKLASKEQRYQEVEERNNEKIGDKDANNVEVVDHHQNQSYNIEPPFMFAGILAALVGSLMFSFSVLCIKLLPEHEGFIGKVKALFFRGFFMSLLCAIAIILRKSTFIIKRDELLVNILRSVFGTTGVFGSYISLMYIGMGESTALIFSSPIWTSILGHFLLKEKLYCSHLIAVPISLLGILFIAHPGLLIDSDSIIPLNNVSPTHSQHPSAQAISEISSSHQKLIATNQTTIVNATITYNKGHQLIGYELGISVDDPEVLENLGDSFDRRWPGLLTAVLTSFMVSVTYVVLKFRKSTPVQTTTFYFGVTIMIFTITILLFTGFGQPPESLYECFLLAGNGIFSWIGQTFFQWAFSYEDASILSILRTLDVALSFALSALFLSEDIYWTSILGSAIIGFVVISLIFNSYLQQMNCCISLKTNKSINRNSASSDNYLVKT